MSLIYDSETVGTVERFSVQYGHKPMNFPRLGKALRTGIYPSRYLICPFLENFAEEMTIFENFVRSGSLNHLTPASPYDFHIDGKRILGITQRGIDQQAGIVNDREIT